MPYGGKLNPAVFGVWQKDLIHPTLQKPQAHLDSYVFSPFMLKPVYIGGGGGRLWLFLLPICLHSSAWFGGILCLCRSLLQSISLGAFFRLQSHAAGQLPSQMWEIKGVHYSLEGRKTVLRESLWLPLSAFSPATVTGADSGCFFL